MVRARGTYVQRHAFTLYMLTVVGCTVRHNGKRVISLVNSGMERKGERMDVVSNKKAIGRERLGEKRSPVSWTEW